MQCETKGQVEATRTPEELLTLLYCADLLSEVPPAAGVAPPALLAPPPALYMRTCVGSAEPLAPPVSGGYGLAGMVYFRGFFPTYFEGCFKL